MKKHVSALFASALLLPGILQAQSNAPAATPVEQIRVAKDFKVELLYNVHKDSQGSWVAMTIDPKGRLIVSDQYGGLYRITPAPLGAPASQTKIEALKVEMGHAQGLLYAFNSLYVMVADDSYQGRGLYRITDTDGDDQFDKVELLRKLFKGGEHGPHAILLNPDGISLTVVIGNQTTMTDLAGSKVPKVWSEDHLLPRMPDGRGFMKDVLGPGGSIFKVSADGKNWELLTTGFRNEYDAAYNHFGDLFTYDADMEWDVNTPWYRPTRICLSAPGADYGWRNGTGKWPVHYADTLPPLVNIGPGSPTGVTFGYGAKFPAKYQEALFICDWSYGKMYAVHLTPNDSAYTATKEEFIAASPLPLTDILISPKDGAMYFAVGGRKTQSGLYRVTYTGKESTTTARPNTRDAADRKLRQKLESEMGYASLDGLKDAWKHLGSDDR
ncbi:MAG TPA: heme-binding protein, partial [Roseimicrobium sp.]|nr:heme-binding protein [Roseimicrobium sp.]